MKRILIIVIATIFILTTTSAQTGWEKNTAGRWVYVLRDNPAQLKPVTPLMQNNSRPAKPAKTIKEKPIASTPAPAIKFDEIKPARSGYRLVRHITKWGVIDNYGSVVVPPIYDNLKMSESYLIGALKNNKWGFVSTNGEVLIDFKFDAVLESFDYGNWPFVIKDGFKFRINNQGEAVGEKIAGNMKDIDIAAAEEAIKKKYIITTEFIEGYAKIRNEKYKCGFIDINYKVIVMPLYEDIFLSNFMGGVAVFFLDGNYGLLDGTGKVVTDVKYDFIDRSYKNNRIPVKLNNLWGYLDSTGAVVIPIKYYEASTFYEKTASVYFEGKYGTIDLAGNVVIPFKYNTVIHFINNAARVRLNGKWGYIDREGKELSEFIYDKVEESKYGMGRGLLNGKWVDVKFNRNFYE